MSWQDEFHEAVTRYLIAKGTPVSECNPYYGWIAPDYKQLRDHLRDCPPDLARCTWEDSRWTEFAGTFAESDNDRHGIDARTWCSCGQVAGRTWRYDGTIGELLKAVTE